MEVINKMLRSQQNILVAQDLMLSSMVQTGAPPTSVNPALTNSLRLLHPEIPPSLSLSLLTNTPWSHMLFNQATTSTWLQQHKKFLATNIAQQYRVNQTPSAAQSNRFGHSLNSQRSSLEDGVENSDGTKTTGKVSFTIDNIMNGKYEKSRKVVQLFEQPSSPAHSSSSSSRFSDTGMGGLKYECEVCTKTYSTFSGFSKHKQFYCVPQAKKQFNCKHCDKTYYSLGALKMHIRTHTLPCKCKVCGKAFSRPWLLQGHMRTHTGEKPFKCQHCGRAFADRSNLRAHLQTHSDIKKYSCKRCDKTFSRMSLLLKHEESSYCSASSTDVVSRMFL